MVKKLQQQLDELLAEWQPQLRCANWDVKIEACRQRDMPEPGSGNIVACLTTLAVKRARIKILDPGDALYSSSAEIEDELEDTVIHELIHLLLPHTATAGRSAFGRASSRRRAAT